MYRPALFSLLDAPCGAPGTGVKNFLSFLVNVLSIRTYLFGQNCVTLMLHSLRNHKIRVKSDRQCHPPARETTKIHAKEVRQTLKSFASSLHAFNQTYHSLQRSAGALLHHAGVILPALVGLYAVATNLLFIPLMQQLWSLTLRFAPVHYLNNSNASDIFVSPAIILCLVVIALLTAFWALYEFSVLLHGLELARSGRPVQLPALLRDALVDIRHTFLPQNWPVLVYSAVLIPFTSFFLTSNYVTQFAVPEYLLGVLRATTRYHALYLAIVVLLVLLFLSCALVLPLFVLEHRSLWQAVRESVGFVRQRIFRTALLLLRWNLSAVLRLGSLALCVLAPLYAVILGIGLQNTAAMVALSRASLLVEVPFFQFLLDCSITIAQCSILFLLYRRLRKGDAVPEDTQNGKPVRAKGRRLLAAAVVGVTLVTIGLSFIYIALPADDELRTMLGGAAPIVTAHRGYSTAAPENTLPAFQLAIDHHSDRAELDVQMTKDGVVMVTHDTSLRRCTGRNANIYDLTFAQVRELEAETVRIIREKGFEKDCVITSQSYEALCKVKELDPEIETGYILALGVGTYYDLPAADFFSVESTFITSGMVQQIHLRGKTVSAWTVNRTEDARALLSLGVDDVITDKPEMVQDLLNEDADLDRNLVLMRDRLKELLGLTESADSEVDPDDSAIEEVLEDPEELLDQA